MLFLSRATEFEFSTISPIINEVICGIFASVSIASLKKNKNKKWVLHPGLSDCNHLVGDPQSMVGPVPHRAVGVLQPGSLGSQGGKPLCVHYSHRCSQQQSHSANANLVFSHPASPSWRQRLAKISVFAEINQALQKLPASHTIPEDQSDPSQRGLQHSEKCAVFCHIFWTSLFQEVRRGRRGHSNGVSSVLEEM